MAKSIIFEQELKESIRSGCESCFGMKCHNKNIRKSYVTEECGIYCHMKQICITCKEIK